MQQTITEELPHKNTSNLQLRWTLNTPLYVILIHVIIFLACVLYQQYSIFLIYIQWCQNNNLIKVLLPPLWKLIELFIGCFLVFLNTQVTARCNAGLIQSSFYQHWQKHNKIRSLYDLTYSLLQHYSSFWVNAYIMYVYRCKYYLN